MEDILKRTGGWSMILKYAFAVRLWALISNFCLMAKQGS